MTLPLFSIGHSNHDFKFVADRLSAAGVTVLADVRSRPYSRFVPAYNSEALKTSLSTAGFGYVYLGRELGGRPVDLALLNNGVPDYDRVAASSAFAEGLERLLKGAETHRIAIMCAERNPAQCHRSRLIGKALLGMGIDVQHLLADGGLILQSDMTPVARQNDLFAS